MSSTVNTAGITSRQLEELLEDDGHKALLSSFAADALTADYTKQVDNLSSLQLLIPIEDNMPDEDGKSAEVGDGAPTPESSSKLDEYRIVCKEWRWKRGISKPRSMDLKTFFPGVVEWLQESAARKVLYAKEKRLMDILRGNGLEAEYRAATSLDLATSSKYWDNYTGAAHSPKKDLALMQRRTGATQLFLGDDVALTLMFSPDFTGQDAGSGRTSIDPVELTQILNRMGFAKVWYGSLFYQNAPSQLPLALKKLHDGIAAMWAPKALRKYSFEPFQYDTYPDEDTRKDYYRALETAEFKSPYKESVGVFKNVLQTPLTF